MTGKTLVPAKDKKSKGLAFTVSTNSEVLNSCGLTFQGKFYIYGGKNKKKQISFIEQCELKPVPAIQLANDFEKGACTVGNGQIYLCFDTASGKQNQKTCFTSDNAESDFAVNITTSWFEHRLIRIASSESKSKN